MKNQYFGDINDYIKYGLLRTLADVTGQKIGVCWMLTAVDERTDGNKIAYLKKPDEYKKCDPELFDRLCSIQNDAACRDVRNARVWNIIQGAEYFEDVLTDGLDDRTRYFSNARSALSACPIIFFDPDNGLEVASIKKGKRNSSKFVYYDELAGCLEEGKALLIFQHFPREDRNTYTARRIGELQQNLHCGKIQAYLTSNVVYFLVAPRGVEYNFAEIDRRMQCWRSRDRSLISTRSHV